MKNTNAEKDLKKSINELEQKLDKTNENFILIQNLKKQIRKIETEITIFTSFYFPFQIMLWSFYNSKTFAIITSSFFFIIFVVAFISLKNKIYLIEDFIDLLTLEKELKKECENEI